MSPSRTLGRREFLKTAPLALAGAAAFPTIVKASTLGRAGAVAPSDRIVMAGIGFGMQGPGNMRNFLGKPEVQWVAVCDLDDVPLKKAQDTRQHEVRQRRTARPTRTTASCSRAATSMRSRSRCPTTGTPSSSISAVRAGLDVYGEKPFTHSLREGRALCNAIARYGRVWQTGSWQRSEDNFHRAAELVAQRPRRQDPARRGRPAVRLHRLRGHVRAGEDREPAGGVRLRHMARPGAVVAVLQGARPHELALEHGLRRRPADGLDRPPSRHRALGPRLRATGPVEIKGKGEFPTTGIYNGAKRFWVETRSTPTARRWSSPAATRRSRAARSGSARPAGSGWTAAGSRASPRTSPTKSSVRTRRGSTGAAITTRTSSTACAAAR